MNDTTRQPAPPSSSGIKHSWLYTLLVLVLLGAIPAAFIMGYLSALEITRIGLLLNFGAGFLISPEILVRGEVLNTLEQRFTSFALSMQNTTNQAQEQINKLFETVTRGRGADTVIISVCIACSLGISFGFKQAGLAFIYPLLASLYALFIISGIIRRLFPPKSIAPAQSDLKRISTAHPQAGTRDPNNLTPGQNGLLRYVAAFILLPLVFPIIVFVYPALFFALQGLRLASGVAQRLVGLLIGNGRLRSILVWWGALFFTVGNVLLLLATF